MESGNVYVGVIGRQFHGVDYDENMRSLHIFANRDSERIYLSVDTNNCR
jgi:hypothetical protein